MARPLRIEQVGGWYHVVARGNERKPIFRDHRDRSHFLELIEEMVSRYRLRLHCYVMMDNHYHLLPELTEPNLSRAVQWLNVSYSVWFNRRHDRTGHLFQGRFKSIAVEREAWALALSRYLHLNPVRITALGLGKSEAAARRAGLAPAPSAEEARRRIELLREYPWSSYRAYAGWTQPPGWLVCDSVLELGGGRASDRPRRYREYVEDAAREGLQQSPWGSVQEQAVLGGVQFLARLRESIKGDKQEQRGASRLIENRPPFAEIVALVEKAKGRKWNQFRDEHGDSGRDMALYLGRRICGLKLRELAGEAGLSNYGVVATNVRRYQLRLKQDIPERRRVDTILKLFNCEM